MMSNEDFVTEETSTEEATPQKPKRAGRPKKPQLLYEALTIKKRNGAWFPVALIIDQNTNKVVDQYDLTPRGTTRVKAILNLEPRAMKWRFNDTSNFEDETDDV